MLEHIRLSLRLTTEVFDSEIESLINGCLADLKLIGIDTNKNDQLIKQAVTLYCKAHFGDMTVKYIDIYENLKTVLALVQNV